MNNFNLENSKIAEIRWYNNNHITTKSTELSFINRDNTITNVDIQCGLGIILKQYGIDLYFFRNFRFVNWYNAPPCLNVTNIFEHIAYV